MPEQKSDSIGNRLAKLFRKDKVPLKEKITPTGAFENFLKRVIGDKDTKVSKVGTAISETVDELADSYKSSAGTVEQFLEVLDWKRFDRSYLDKSLLLPFELWRGWKYEKKEMSEKGERGGVDQFLLDSLVGAPMYSSLNASFQRNSIHDTTFVFAIKGQYGEGSTATGRAKMESYRAELQPEGEKSSGVHIWTRVETNEGVYHPFAGRGSTVGHAVELPIETLAGVIKKRLEEERTQKLV